MANVLESLIVKLALDGSDYSDNIKKAQGSLDGFASGAKNIGGALSLGVTTPLAAIGMAAINAASDVNESMSKVEVVFGTNAAAIESWSATAATALGQSQQGALEAAGTFGNLFSAMGLGQQDTLDMSKGVVQLASDLASFNNISPEEALDKLRAGLVGEAEPLRALGVNLSAAGVAAEAVRLGLAAQGDELTAAQKAQASYSLILQQTTAAQGDFARTSDGLANSQRIVSAELADTTAELGKELLPIALEVAKGLQSLLGWFTSLSPETKQWVVIVAGIAAAAGPVIAAIGFLASGISTIIAVATAAAPVIAGVGAALTLLTGPIGLIVLAIAGLALAWNSDFGGIQEKTKAFWDWLTTSTPQVIGGVQSAWGTFTGWLQSNTAGALTAVQGFWQAHQEAVVGIQNSQWKIIGGIYQTQIDLISGLIKVAMDLWRGDWSGAATDLKTTSNTLWSDLGGIFQGGLDAIKSLFDLFGWHDLGENIAKGIADGVTAGLHWITEAASGAAQAALEAAKSILGISSPSARAADEIGDPFTKGFSKGAIDAMPAATAGIQKGINALFGDITLPGAGQAGAGSGGSPINITINMQGGGSYADGQAIGRGVTHELRIAGF